MSASALTDGGFISIQRPETSEKEEQQTSGAESERVEAGGSVGPPASCGRDYGHREADPFLEEEREASRKVRSRRLFSFKQDLILSSTK